ncbi:MAG: VOC family protein [Acidimicrobiia bacterium]
MATFQLTIDCSDPDRLARFWSAALAYDLQGPPDGHDSWRAFWLSVGVPEDEVEDGYDAIIDPTGDGPRIWFQRVAEVKSQKNRVHVDLLVGAGRGIPLEERRERVEAAVDRLIALGAARRHTMDSPDQDHYAVAMADPEGNEFDIV